MKYPTGTKHLALSEVRAYARARAAVSQGAAVLLGNTQGRAYARVRAVVTAGSSCGACGHIKDALTRVCARW